MMLGRSRCLLEDNGLDAAFSSPLNNSMSSLLSTYLNFVPIQAKFISELHPVKISNNKSLLSRVEYVVHDLLERLERVHARIVEVCWSYQVLKKHSPRLAARTFRLVEWFTYWERTKHDPVLVPFATDVYLAITANLLASSAVHRQRLFGVCAHGDDNSESNPRSIIVHH